MKVKKYVLTMVLALLCVLCVPKVAMAAANSGSCGPNATWTYENGVLTISGTGEVDDNPWMNDYSQSITSVIVQEGITVLDVYRMFENCINLKQVSLPNSLTKMEFYAFKGCTSLTSITIPKNLEDASTCFEGSGLKTVTFANGITSVPFHMFENCTTLETVNFASTITTLEDGAFENCTGLKQITLPKNLVDIGMDTFRGCTGLTSITIPKTVVKANGGHSFEDTGIKVAVIENGATVVPCQLFAECKTLTTVNMPQSIKKIEDYAFENCTGLTKLALPWYLEKIGYYAFNGCTNLKELTMYQNVKEINAYAFKNVKGLKIRGKAKSTAQTFAKEQGYSFATCKIPALKGITYTKDNIKYKVVTDYINGKGTVMVIGMKKNASSVTIPKTVKLESYNYKVVKIGNKAFYKKSKLKKVTIQSTYITSIGKYAFKGINKYATFKVPRGKITQYKKLLTSKTGFTKKTMKIKK